MAGLVKRAMEMEHKFYAAQEAEEEGDDETADAMKSEAEGIEVRLELATFHVSLFFSCVSLKSV